MNGSEKYESEILKKITEEISTKLNRPPLHIADYPVGLKVRMQHIQEFMGGEFDKKVTMLGIHGMRGIGKSTLSRAMYNLMAHQFEASHFLANVREKSYKDGLMHIQETMMSELMGERNIKLGDNSKVLRHLIVVGCKNIRRIPDISGFPNLTKLCVGECTNLFEIHDSVGSLLHLKVFCAEGCTKLTIGLSRIELKSLEHLCFQGCSSLVMFPLNINQFYAANCSVKANSLILKLRQAIDSAAMRICFLPGREIPELFDHSSGGHSSHHLHKYVVVLGAMFNWSKKMTIMYGMNGLPVQDFQFSVSWPGSVYASEGVSDAVIDPSQHLHDKKRAKRSQEPLADKVTVKSMQCNAGKSSLAASLSLPLHIATESHTVKVTPPDCHIAKHIPKILLDRVCHRGDQSLKF
ncbi:Disease resistance protein [Vigna angularis]|uniref:Disease resistance protein n=1 Tax=Phaseolus angularis TaxID=3914 RepID=A0A8T0JWE0_PHAAN|nr:Disease resistance protein [Vigna angularis]